MNPCLLTGPGICAVVPNIRKRSRIVRSGFAIGIRVRMREGTPCTLAEGQRTIGVRRHGLDGVHIQRSRRGGSPPSEREGTCKTRPPGTKNVDGVGRFIESQFGTGAREVPDMWMQDNESNGGPQKKGGRKGHLGFGDVNAGRDGHVDRSIGDWWKRATIGCRGDNDHGETDKRRNRADGWGLEEGRIQRETTAWPATGDTVVGGMGRMSQADERSFLSREVGCWRRQRPGSSPRLRNVHRGEMVEGGHWEVRHAAGSGAKGQGGRGNAIEDMGIT